MVAVAVASALMVQKRKTGRKDGVEAVRRSDGGWPSVSLAQLRYIAVDPRIILDHVGFLGHFRRFRIWESRFRDESDLISNRCYTSIVHICFSETMDNGESREMRTCEEVALARFDRLAAPLVHATPEPSTIAPPVSISSC